MPVEAIDPLAYSDRLKHRDYTTFALLDKPVVKLDRYLMYSDLDGSNLIWTVPLHSLAPWTVNDERHFVLAQSFFTEATAAEAGGKDKIYPQMWEYQEEIYPGFCDAITHTATQEHRHHWALPLCAGPKLPRRLDSTRGLWFVNDASTPIAGIGAEAAVSAGVLGGIEIASHLAGR